MASRRVLKAAEAIREVVSMAILTELRDPRVKNVTVTFVEVAPDMRTAKIHVSIMGDEGKQKLTMRGLENAAGFLQQRVADRIDTRYTPRLQFVLDLGVKNSIAVSRILAEVLPKPDPLQMGSVNEASDEISHNISAQDSPEDNGPASHATDEEAPADE